MKYFSSYFNPVNEYGQKVARTKSTHPYSYDGFVTYDNRKNVKAEDTVYSDRLWQWDYSKASRLSEKYFENKGQHFDRRSPQSIEKFLSDYFGYKVKIAMIMEYCNQSSGYPCWRFDYAKVVE